MHDHFKKLLIIRKQNTRMFSKRKNIGYTAQYLLWQIFHVRDYCLILGDMRVRVCGAGTQQIRNLSIGADRSYTDVVEKR